MALCLAPLIGLYLAGADNNGDSGLAPTTLSGDH